MRRTPSSPSSVVQGTTGHQCDSVLNCLGLSSPSLSLSPTSLSADRFRMSSVEEVPFKIPLGALGEVQEEVDLVPAPDITLPDYLTILQETEVSAI